MLPCLPDSRITDSQAGVTLEVSKSSHPTVAPLPPNAFLPSGQAASSRGTPETGNAFTYSADAECTHSEFTMLTRHQARNGEVGGGGRRQ